MNSDMIHNRNKNTNLHRKKKKVLPKLEGGGGQLHLS